MTKSLANTCVTLGALAVSATGTPVVTKEKLFGEDAVSGNCETARKEFLTDTDVSKQDGLEKARALGLCFQKGFTAQKSAFEGVVPTFDKKSEMRVLAIAMFKAMVENNADDGKEKLETFKKEGARNGKFAEEVQRLSKQKDDVYAKVHAALVATTDNELKTALNTYVDKALTGVDTEAAGKARLQKVFDNMKTADGNLFPVENKCDATLFVPGYKHSDTKDYCSSEDGVYKDCGGCKEIKAYHDQTAQFTDFDAQLTKFLGQEKIVLLKDNILLEPVLETVKKIGDSEDAAAHTTKVKNALKEKYTQEEIAAMTAAVNKVETATAKKRLGIQNDTADAKLKAVQGAVKDLVVKPEEL